MTCVHPHPSALLAAAILATPLLAAGQGGPPLMTDDPATPGPAGWEVNVASLADIVRAERRLEVPRVDVNYGVGTRIQLKWEAPLVFLTRESATRIGPGDANVGMKWRFLGEDDGRIAWSVYPQLEFNSARTSIPKGIGEEGKTLALPTQVAASIGPARINVEVGRVFQSQSANGWMYGVAVANPWRRTRGLVAEVHGEQPDHGAGELDLNGAIRPPLTNSVSLLLAFGRTLRTPDAVAHYHVYLGLQFNVAPRGVIADDRERTDASAP